MSRSTGVLGRGLDTWRTHELEKTLEHYRLSTDAIASKWVSRKSRLHSRLKEFVEANEIIWRDVQQVLGLRNMHGTCRSPKIVEKKACKCFNLDNKCSAQDQLEQNVPLETPSDGVSNDLRSTVIPRSQLKEDSAFAIQSVETGHDETPLEGSFRPKTIVSNDSASECRDINRNFTVEKPDTSDVITSHNVGLNLKPLDTPTPSSEGSSSTDSSFDTTSNTPLTSETGTPKATTQNLSENLQSEKPATLVAPKRHRSISGESLGPRKAPHTLQSAGHKRPQKVSAEKTSADSSSANSTAAVRSLAKSPDKSASMRSCAICADPIRTGNNAIGLIFSDCEEPHEICLACIARSLQTQFETKVWNQMACPVCDVPLYYADMKKYAPGPVFERYDQMATFDAMSQLPGFCYCQQPGCGAGQIHEDQHEQPIVTCIGCGNKTCYTHQSQWHAGRTCAEYDEMLRANRNGGASADLASDATIVSMTKPCPKCRRPIEKNGGCQHMTCTVCRQEFCWDCSALWERIETVGNTAHNPQCPWHSNNLPSLTVGHAAEILNGIDQMDEVGNLNAYLWF